MQRRSYPSTIGLVKPGTILVVEDDASIRSLVADVLSDENLPVNTVGDGYDAVTWLRNHRPAMVILDLQLPRVTGEGVLRELVSMYHGDVPVITMTAGDSTASTLQRRGAWSHLKKPFMLDDLLRVVHSYL